MKRCLKCGFDNPDNIADPLAACPKCGAIYARVEAHAAKAGIDPASAAAEAKARAQFNKTAPAPPRLPALPKPVFAAAPARRRWFTPSFALVIFVGYTVLMGLFALVMAVSTGGNALSMGFVVALLIVYALGAIVLELIMVVFHMSATLEDCRELLAKIAEHRA